METQTETKQQQNEVQPTIASVSALASTSRATTVLPWRKLEWSEELKQTLRKAIAPPSASDAEVDYFRLWCERTGLDPFVKQAYLVERYDSVSNTKKHEPMAAEAGMAALADSMPDFRGMRSGVVYAGDEFIIDEETQMVHHRWNPAERAKNKMQIIGAWAHGKRDGRETEITYLTLDSRIARKRDGTPTKFWATDPAGQLRKCARADQYRRLYPNLFAGAYVEGELRDDAIEVEVNEAPKSAKSGNASLKEKLGVKPIDSTATVLPVASSAPPIDCLRFGPSKGKKLTECTDAELTAAHAVATEQLSKATGKEKWFQNVKEGIDAVDAEVERRAGLTEGERIASEPGSEG